MIKKSKILGFHKSIVIAIGFMLFAIDSHAAIEGITGPVFYLSARADNLSTPDGGSILFWSYAETDKSIGQYPGPTLIVTEGDVVTVNLLNELDDVPVSIVFPGQVVTTVPSGDNPGLITEEVPPGGDPVAYTFTATHPGTYMYHSGTRMELELEMGLVGALIVRPVKGEAFAYNHADTGFNREILFLLTEMDPLIHEQVAMGNMELVDFTERFTNYWFINGRAAPDTMRSVNDELLPTQPYNCLPIMHPGDQVLLRIIGAGSDLHPFHHHGNHSKIIARNGRMLSSTPEAGPDMASYEFTIQAIPGQTVDSIFEWTGEELGWDIYGHTTDDESTLEAFEYAQDHGKPIPTVTPDVRDLVRGPFYSGSPYLGSSGPLPPGDGGFNLNNGMVFMWHSHNEREMVNRGMFPGGMMTMLIIEHPLVDINP